MCIIGLKDQYFIIAVANEYLKSGWEEQLLILQLHSIGHQSYLQKFSEHLGEIMGYG